MNSAKDIKVSIVGSFRKSPEELKLLFEFVQATYTLLSPTSIGWNDSNAEFVRTDVDANLDTAKVEDRHLEALRDSDFIILHAPDGYVGTSATYELGFAKALGIPIFSTHLLSDQILGSFVMPFEFHQDGLDNNFVENFDSGLSLKSLQTYYKRTAKRRGWDKETAKDTLVLLMEELGELARAVRKYEKMNRDHEYNGELSEELADTQLYLVHLANQTGVDLGEAVTTKEKKNEERFRNR